MYRGPEIYKYIITDLIISIFDYRFISVFTSIYNYMIIDVIVGATVTY